MKLLLISPANVYATERLSKESAKLGIALTTITVFDLAQLNYGINPVDFDALYIRQGHIEQKRKMALDQFTDLINLAQRFQEARKIVVDESMAQGDLGRGKQESLLRLAEQGIPVPAPVREFPLVAKWNYGSSAKHTFLITSDEEFRKIKLKYPVDQLLLQQFIAADYEYKVITVGYKSLPLVIKLKSNDNKFLPDFSGYEVLSSTDASEVVSLAERSSQILQRELAKVDILEADGQLYVLEVNRWPGFHHFEKTTGYNVAKDFLQYIQKKMERA